MGELTREDLLSVLKVHGEHMDRKFDELRGGIAEELNVLHQEMGKQFGEVHQEMDKQFGEIHQEMDKRFGEVHQEMGKQFGEIHQEMDRRFGEVHTRLDVLEQEVVDIRTILKVIEAKSTSYDERFENIGKVAFGLKP